MNTPKTDPVELVFSLLQEITLRPRSEIRPEQDLQRDLRISGDDLSMWFALELQGRLDIRPTNEEWRAVRTVRDALDLVKRHCSGR